MTITASDGSVAFGQLRRQLSASYLLAFEAQDADRDGNSHKIEVRVERLPGGSLVRARKSFRIVQRLTSGTDLARRPPEPKPAAGEPPVDPPASANVLPAEAASSLPADAEGLARAVAVYAARFEREYSAVVAEERYVQIIHPWRGTPKGPEAEPSLGWVESGGPPAGKPIVMRRQLLSDVLLVQVAGQDWMAYRDVAAVDGRAVRAREERLRALLMSPLEDRFLQLRRIGDESARYDLGAMRRTMNLPNVALAFMRSETQGRFRFERKRDERLGLRSARVLAYRGRSNDTLVRTPEGRSVPAYGQVWLDPEDGSVLRTELRLDRPGEERGVRWSTGDLRSVVRVEFARVFDDGVPLPSAMWEWYEGVDVPGGITEERSTAQGLATYSDYRRFGVSTSEAVKP